MHIEREERAIRDESVVPLINVVFLLLIFFLLVGTLAPAPDLDLNYAETSESPAAEAPADALYVSAAGHLSYRGNSLDREELSAAIAAGPGELRREPLKVVLDRALLARDIAPVLNAIAEAGVTRVELVTLKERAR